PTLPLTDDEGPSLDRSGRVVALETQVDNAPGHDIDTAKPVVIGLQAEVRWDVTPQVQASQIVEELREYIDIEGEDVIFVTAILVDAIRTDRTTAWVKLV
ncbi:MAG: hypothetical protein DRP09_19505, partial [Candidatus Thorarchaeota archaeon]